MHCKHLGLLTVALVTAMGCARPRVGAIPEAAFAYPRPPEISVEAWTHATAAYQQAGVRGLATGSLLTVIDYTLPSTARRLWVVELGTGAVLMNEYVAHGSRSGGTWATSFSNRTGSKRSSLGTFITAGSYAGVRGIARRLVGLEPGINDHALQRGIVIHGTPGVSAARALSGKLGRTEGCPAVPRESARRLINLLGEGSVVFIWYPDRALLSSSEYVDHGAAAMRLPGLN